MSDGATKMWQVSNPEVAALLDVAAVIAQRPYESTSEDVEDGELLAELGATYRALGREEEARLLFVKVVDFVQPSLKQGYSTTIATLFENGADAEAQALIQRWRQFAETVPPDDTYAALGNVVYSLTLARRFGEALEVTTLIHPSIYHTNIYSVRAWFMIPIYVEMEDFERVRSVISDLPEPDTKVEYWLRAALQFAQNERVEEANNALQGAISLSHEFSEEVFTAYDSDHFFYKIAEIHAALGDLETGLSIASQNDIEIGYFRQVKEMGVWYLTRTRCFVEAIALNESMFVERTAEHEAISREYGSTFEEEDEFRNDIVVWRANALSTVTRAMAEAGQLVEAKALLTHLWSEVDKRPGNHATLACLISSFAKAGFADEAINAFAELYRIPQPINNSRQKTSSILLDAPRRWALSILQAITALAKAGLVYGNDSHIAEGFRGDSGDCFPVC